MNLDDQSAEYLNELERKIKAYLSDNQGEAELRRMLKNLEYDYLQELRAKIFMKLNYLHIPDRYDNLVSPILDGFTRLGDKINDDVLASVREGFRRDLNDKQVRNLINDKIQGAEQYAKTWAWTGSAGIQNAERIQMAINAGYKYFKFIGPVPERKFCKLHIEEVLSVNEILRLDNNQGLTVIYFGGGYNCRHEWVPVPESEYVKYSTTDPMEILHGHI